MLREYRVKIKMEDGTVESHTLLLPVDSNAFREAYNRLPVNVKTEHIVGMVIERVQ